MKITATIITFNEEANINAACKSVAWADEILVVDSESSDNTRRLAEQAGARVVVNKWPGFAAQKQLATEQASGDWVFSLDADERVSEKLKASITSLKTNGPRADAYRMARRTFYQGRWIRGGGWYPDWQLRLFRKSLGHWKQRHIHESVQLDEGAKVATLAGDLLHETVRDAAHHHQMIGERYAPLSALQMFEEGRRASSWSVATAGPSAFIRSFVLKGGFRDGLAGISIASFAAHHAFLKHLLLLEMQRKEKKD